MAEISRRSFLSLAGASAGALFLGACSSGGAEGSGTATIEWWHIGNTDPMLSIWAGFAQEYEKAHQGVKVTITPLENEAYKARLTTVVQAGNPPDIFHTWGGGVLKQQIDAGLAKDISGDVAPWIGNLAPASVQPYQFDNRTYAVPFDIGMVGFWYNKELFSRAGISAPPATWAELLEAVRKLKAASVVPIALAGKDKWPGHYYWAYLAMRSAGLDALQQAAVDGDFNKPEFVSAGTRLKELVDLAPFQTGFLGAEYGTPDGQAATMGNGRAGMELMGQWAPAVQKSATSSAGLGDKLGFFPFPALDGGKGRASDAFGGGGGYAVGRDAPAEAVDFLKFISQVENQRRAAATGAILPVTRGAEDAIKDPNLATVAKNLSEATGFQLFLDQAYPPAVGQQVNDSVAALIAGKKSAEQVTQEITETAKNQ